MPNLGDEKFSDDAEGVLLRLREALDCGGEVNEGAGDMAGDLGDSSMPSSAAPPCVSTPVDMCLLGMRQFVRGRQSRGSITCAIQRALPSCEKSQPPG